MKRSGFEVLRVESCQDELPLFPELILGERASEISMYPCGNACLVWMLRLISEKGGV